MAKFSLTPQGIVKGMMYVGIGLVFLGLIKQALPDVWSKVPGLNQF